MWPHSTINHNPTQQNTCFDKTLVCIVCGRRNSESNASWPVVRDGSTGSSSGVASILDTILNGVSALPGFPHDEDPIKTLLGGTNATSKD